MYGGDAFFEPSSSVALLNLASQLLGAAILFGGVFLYLEKNKGLAGENPGNPECPRCEGTGYEACILCSRWAGARAQAGCSSCVNGVQRCKSCGGGGTAVPIDSRMRISTPEQERQQLIDMNRKTRNY
jgi:hypothetical protein